jgi:hypothetical protein
MEQANMKQKYTPPAKHSQPDDYDMFLESLTPQEHMLMEIAENELGSSFYVRWCHAYNKWKANQKK